MIIIRNPQTSIGNYLGPYIKLSASFRFDASGIHGEAFRCRALNFTEQGCCFLGGRKGQATGERRTPEFSHMPEIMRRSLFITVNTNRKSYSG